MADEKKGIIAGFTDFISRGNAMDMAVGVVIGGAFTAIITAIVEKVLNPAIGAIFGQPNFDTALTLTINGADIMFGTIITALVNFLLVALALYLCVVVPMNKLHAAREARAVAKAGPLAEETPAPTTEELLTEIRDLLAKQG